MKKCEACGSYIITQEDIEELRKSGYGHPDPVGEPGIGSHSREKMPETAMPFAEMKLPAGTSLSNDADCVARSPAGPLTKAIPTARSMMPEKRTRKRCMPLPRRLPTMSGWLQPSMRIEIAPEKKS